MSANDDSERLILGAINRAQYTLAANGVQLQLQGSSLAPWDRRFSTGSGVVRAG